MTVENPTQDAQSCGHEEGQQEAPCWGPAILARKRTEMKKVDAFAERVEKRT